MRNKNRQSGFTLVELLVILAIISFLVAAVFLALSRSRQKSRDAKRVADIKQISSALDLFNSHCGAYPVEATAIPIDSTQKLFTSSGSCGALSGSSSVNGGIGPIGTVLGASNIVIVAQFVSAPLPPDGSCTDALSSNQYTYTRASTTTTYTLTFCLGAATGGFSAGVNTITR